MEKADDFDPKAAYTDLSAQITQPDKFARLFCDAAEKQKDIDKALKKIIRDLIKEDSETQNSIKVYIKEVEQEDLKAYFRKIGSKAWGTVIFISGAVFTTIIHFVFQKYIK